MADTEKLVMETDVLVGSSKGMNDHLSRCLKHVLWLVELTNEGRNEGSVTCGK